MRRRTFVVSATGVLAASALAGAQPAARGWRIGYLSLASERLAQYRLWIGAFREELHRRGYVEGQNLLVEERYAAG